MNTIIGPYESCCEQVWNAMKWFYDRNGVMEIPEYEHITQRSRRITRMRVHAHATSKLPISVEKEHVDWCRYKRLQGWRYGNGYDYDRMEHPMLKPFAACQREHQESIDICRAIFNQWRPIVRQYHADLTAYKK